VRYPSQLGSALLLVLMGFLIVVQVRAGRALTAGASLPSQRVEDLTVLLRRQQEADRMLRDEVASLAAKLAAYRAAEARGRSVALEMQQELAGLRVQLGLTRVRGPGLVVVVAAAPGRLAVPQAQDLSSVLNELWAAGAEAAAVNGVRVLATTGFVPAAEGVRAGGRTLRGPYTIAAIGDAAAMEGALLVRGGPVDGLRGVGLAVTLAARPDLVLPAYATPAGFRFARPATPP